MISMFSIVPIPKKIYVVPTFYIEDVSRARHQTCVVTFFILFYFFELLSMLMDNG